MNHGEVRWCTFRLPDRRRPVLVLTRDSAIPFLNEITVAPITSHVRQAASQVLLDLDDGMLVECAINFHHLQTVRKSSVGSLITSLNPERMAEARTALLFAMGFDD